MRFLTRSLVGVALLCLTAGLLGYAGIVLKDAIVARMADEGGARNARERVFTANVMPLVPTEIAPQMQVFGELRSRRSLELRAAIGGTVVDVHPAFEDGGIVRQGTILLSIDASGVETALEKTLADLREAEGESADAAAAVLLAEDELAAARRQAELRAAALARQEGLLERGVGTETTLETAALAEASASQAVVSRRQALAQAQTRVTQAEIRLDRRRIEVAEAERALNDTQVTAEFDGTLSDITVLRGGIVTANERLGLLIDPTSLEVAFRVSAAQYLRLIDDAGALKPAAVTVTLDLLATEIAATGTLSRAAASVSEGQTGRLLFARLDDTRGLQPGDLVTVNLQEAPVRGVVALPATAVSSDGEVLLLGDEDRLETGRVEIVRRQGNEVLVRAAALAGREVVTERSPVLGAGIKINPIRPQVGDRAAVEIPATVSLDPERRARLIGFVEANSRMPADVKERLLLQLRQDEVPARVVERLEGRMGG